MRQVFGNRNTLELFGIYKAATCYIDGITIDEYKEIRNTDDETEIVLYTNNQGHTTKITPKSLRKNILVHAEPIKVVVNGKSFSTYVYVEDGHKYFLPHFVIDGKKHQAYSAGFMLRVADCEWDDLEPLI